MDENNVEGYVIVFVLVAALIVIALLIPGAINPY